MNRTLALTAAVLLTLIGGSPVIATVNKASELYKQADGVKAEALLPANAEVELLRDIQEQWYYVRDIATDKRGWIRRDALDIPEDTPASKEIIGKEELEAFAGLMGYASDTPYLALVDIERQQVHVFKGTKHKWKLIKSMPCSSGKNGSPTPRGQFALIDRGLWFYSERLSSGGKYWARFEGAYLFHSVPMDRKGRVLDETIGERCSNGCVRLGLGDAEWFYENVPDRSRVVIP